VRRLAVAALAGCWTSSSPATTPVAPPEPQIAVVQRPRVYKSPCELAADHVFEIARDELEKVADFAGRVDTVRNAAIESCNEQHWSGEMLDCFNALTDAGGLGACVSRLTTDQTSDLMRRLTEVLTQPAQQTP